ncbi:integrase core domain-containing protein [Terasakiispira papahanaumokuakeensis]
MQLRKPHQNGFVERFNHSFRYEFLDVYLFEGCCTIPLPKSEKP